MLSKHRPYTAETREILEDFDYLPDDAVVPLAVSRAMRGNVSKWSDYRNPPPLRLIPISAGRVGHRVGDLRAYNRGLLEHHRAPKTAA